MAVPNFDIVQAVSEAAKSSEIVREVKRAKALFKLLAGNATELRKAGFKPLSPTQLKQLKNQGNTAEDWKRVWVGPKFDPKRVNRSHFIGPNLLSACTGEVKVEGVSFPAGISHATLSHTVAGQNVLIRNVRLIHATVIQEGAVLFDVGTLSKGKSDSFANGMELLIAVETGGREVHLFSELTVEGAWRLARSRANKRLLSDYTSALEGYVKVVSAPFNVIGPSARVGHTPKLLDIFLGNSAHVDSAQLLENVTVLSNAQEATEISSGAIVKSSILQWGSEVTSGAIVDTSLLTEHSHVERHGKVTHSILGPNTGVAEGEVTSALLGPFVGFHHQALLIAALWPEGKGNVAYGANIGSNHTAKAPDQEIWPGEGTFFGLGCNIKFPTDLTQSPYTIMASGVGMLPQRVEFPFSLINTPARLYPGISPAYNEIMPAWVLSDNIYMVKRNEGKYQKRNKACRSKFDFEVFRPEIVDMMQTARKRLFQVEGPPQGKADSPRSVANKEVYTSKEVEGLGKNYMTEAARKQAIETYTFYIRYYALLGFKRELSKSFSSARATDLSKWLQTQSPDPRWEHERQILLSEYPRVALPELLKELIAKQEEIAKQVQVSKEKDDKRGASVIADYAQAHPPASEDSFVKETHQVTAALKAEVEQLLSRIVAESPSHQVTR